MDVSYSDGRTVKNAIIQIWDDLNSERAGFYRAFWCADKDATTGSPVIGYCSAGGSHKTIRAAAAEARRLHPAEAIYRCGRIIVEG